ncbi:VOC family protein [Spirochaetota bacterium]
MNKKDNSVTRKDFMGIVKKSIGGAAALSVMGALTGCDESSSGNPFGEFRHVGYIVDSNSTTIDIFKAIFNPPEEDIRVVSAGVSLMTFIKINGIEFEFIEPKSDFYWSLLGYPRVGINHIAFTVKDIEATVQNLTENREYYEDQGFRVGYISNKIMDMGSSWVAYLEPADLNENYPAETFLTADPENIYFQERNQLLIELVQDK